MLQPSLPVPKHSVRPYEPPWFGQNRAVPSLPLSSFCCSSGLIWAHGAVGARRAAWLWVCVALGLHGFGSDVSLLCFTG